MDDEAELASVLGHEIGHIAADHSRGRQNRGILTQLGALAIGVLTGSGDLAQLAGTVGQGLFLSYSRSQEYEADALGIRSEEHTSELQSLMRISYAVFCLQKKTQQH